MAGSAASERVFAGRNYTFSTTCPSTLYIESAFRSLQHFNTPRVAVIRDKNEPICPRNIVAEVSSQSPVELYGYYELDQDAADYKDQIRAILVDLQANGVESVLGCSYQHLCIHVSPAAGILPLSSCPAQCRRQWCHSCRSVLTKCFMCLLDTVHCKESRL